MVFYALVGIVWGHFYLFVVKTDGVFFFFPQLLVLKLIEFFKDVIIWQWEAISAVFAVIHSLNVIFFV